LDYVPLPDDITAEAAVGPKDFVTALTTSLLMILTSEIGDKTFFIAAIMSMTHSRALVFSAAMGALFVMTVLSAAMGSTLPNLIPHYYTHALSIVLFFFFGFRLLKSAYDHKPADKNEELVEVEQELEAKEKYEETAELEEGKVRASPKGQWFKSFLSRHFSPIFIQCFTMTFLAEWGDRSQIATIVLASAKDAIGVTLGGILGHAICTGMAVIGGKLLATRISERMVAFVGGILFICFALHSLMYPND